MKQRRLDKAAQTNTSWTIRTVAILLTVALAAGPLSATPISNPDTPDADDTPSVCVLTAHDLWVARVSEFLRALGLMWLRNRFVHSQLEGGRYACSG